MYRIRYERRAERELLSLPSNIGRRIGQTIDRLADEPRPIGCRKVLGGEDTYRIKVGRYRVIYEIIDDERLIVILRVWLRTETTYCGL